MSDLSNNQTDMDTPPHSNLTLGAALPRNTRSAPADVPADEIKQVSGDIATFFSEVITPALVNPLKYIEEAVQRIIDHSSATPELKARINSKTPISVRFVENQSGPAPLPGLIREGKVPVMLPKSQMFTLDDIVTDSYRRVLKGASLERIEWPADYPTDLTSALENANVQADYRAEIERKFTHPDVEFVTKSLLEHELDTCFKTYMVKGKSLRHRQLIQAFIERKVTLKTVTFNGSSSVELAQVALLQWPSADSRWKTDDSLLIFLGEGTDNAIFELPGQATARRKAIQGSAVLRQKILARLPLYERLREGNDTVSYRQLYTGSKVRRISPLNFFTSDDILGDLYVRRIERMLSDMDTLVSTDGERTVDKLLEAGSFLLQAVSIAVLLPGAGPLLAGRILASFLLGQGVAAIESLRGSLADTPQEADVHYRAAFVASVAEVAAPLAFKILGKALSKAAQTQIAQRVTELLRRSYNLKPSDLIANAAKIAVKPTVGQIKRAKNSLLHKLALGHEEAQKIVLKQSRLNSKTVEGYELVVYRGQVFRGDLRPPQVIFSEGFTLKASKAELKRDIHQLTGVRGGFGADATADGLDGRGLSTSVFYRKEHVGAATYGVDRGGFNYVIDARKYDGYHLYQNQHNARYVKAQDLMLSAFATEDDYLRALKNAEHNPKLTPGAQSTEPLTFSPTEINYADDLPPSAILGAYDQNGIFIVNDVGLEAFAREQVKRKNRKLLRKASASTSAKKKPEHHYDDAPPEPLT